MNVDFSVSKLQSIQVNSVELQCRPLAPLDQLFQDLFGEVSDDEHSDSDDDGGCKAKPLKDLFGDISTAEYSDSDSDDDGGCAAKPIIILDDETSPVAHPGRSSQGCGPAEGSTALAQDSIVDRGGPAENSVGPPRHELYTDLAENSSSGPPPPRLGHHSVARTSAYEQHVGVSPRTCIDISTQTGAPPQVENILLDILQELRDLRRAQTQWSHHM